MRPARDAERPRPARVVVPTAKMPHDASGVHELLRTLGVVPSKGWGQSFLTDPFVADAEAALVAARTGPAVEVGGGLGMLTNALVRRGLAPLTVIERDPRLAAFLRRTFDERVRLVRGDALEVPVDPNATYVGNLPYSVASPLLMRLMAARVPRIVFLVQREVAERLAAGPGSKAYGRPSILARLYGRTELMQIVPPEAFAPRPRVESRLAVFDGRPGELPVPSVPELERVVRILFSSRRKQLGNLLPRIAPGRVAAEELARAASWPEGWAHERPEDRTPEEYFALARAMTGLDDRLDRGLAKALGTHRERGDQEHDPDQGHREDERRAERRRKVVG